MKVVLESLSYERGDIGSTGNDVHCGFEYEICNEHQIRVTMDALVGSTQDTDKARFNLHTQFSCYSEIAISLIEEERLVATCIEEIATSMFRELVGFLDELTKR